MKSKILTLAIFVFISVFTVSAQDTLNKVNVVGTYKFNAPYAPEGFTTGTIEVSFSENNYGVSVKFTGSDYKLQGDKVKYENDTLNFKMYVEGQDIAITLRPAEESKMVGKASYFEGEIPMTLIKEQPRK